MSAEEKWRRFIQELTNYGGEKLAQISFGLSLYYMLVDVIRPQSLPSAVFVALDNILPGQ